MQTRMLLKERREQRREPHQAERGLRGQDDAADHTLSWTEGLPGVVDARKDHAGSVEELAPSLREMDATGGASYQRRAELPFEPT